MSPFDVEAESVKSMDCVRKQAPGEVTHNVVVLCCCWSKLKSRWLGPLVICCDPPSTCPEQSGRARAHNVWPGSPRAAVLPSRPCGARVPVVEGRPRAVPRQHRQQWRSKNYPPAALSPWLPVTSSRDPARRDNRSRSQLEQQSVEGEARERAECCENATDVTMRVGTQGQWVTMLTVQEVEALGEARHR